MLKSIAVLVNVCKPKEKIFKNLKVYVKIERYCLNGFDVIVYDEIVCSHIQQTRST